MIHGFGGFGDLVYEIHSLHEVCELEIALNRGAVFLPAGKLL
jgi:hypothetical protein